MVITGTSDGIGRGLAKFYSEGDYVVFGCSRSDSTYVHEKYTHHKVDVSKESSVVKWIREIKKLSGKIDVLVCNAGLVKSSLLLSLTPASVAQEFIDTHFMGTFLVNKEVSKIMIQQKYGRIVNIATLGIPLHLEGTAAYSASKSAVVEMSKILANELAPIGITCNVLSPSLYKSESAKIFGDKWAEDLLSRQTLSRYANIQDIANVVSFFASDDSSMITGQVINLGLVT